MASLSSSDGFVRACRDGDITKIKLLLRVHHIDPYIIKTDAFSVACVNGHTHIVDYIIDVLKLSNPTTIHVVLSSVGFWHFSLFESLLKRYHTDCSNELAKSIFSKTCKQSDLRFVQLCRKYFLHRSCKFAGEQEVENRRSEKIENYGLYVACENGHAEVVKYLLTIGKRKHPRVFYQGADLAAFHNHMDVIKCIFKELRNVKPQCIIQIIFNIADNIQIRKNMSNKIWFYLCREFARHQTTGLNTIKIIVKLLKLNATLPYIINCIKHT